MMTNVSEKVKSMVYLDQDESHHYGNSMSQTYNDLKLVQQMQDIITEMINPFVNQHDGLVNIVTGQKAKTNERPYKQ